MNEDSSSDSDDSSYGNHRDEESDDLSSSDSEESFLDDKFRSNRWNDSPRRHHESDDSQESFIGDRFDDSPQRPMEYYQSDDEEESDHSFIGENTSKPLQEQNPSNSVEFDDSFIGDSRSKSVANQSTSQEHENSRNFDDSSIGPPIKDTTTKRLVKLKVWDEDDPNNTSILTVEVDIPTKRQDLLNADEWNATLSVGQVIEIRQREIQKGDSRWPMFVELGQCSVNAVDRERPSAVNTPHSPSEPMSSKEPQSTPIPPTKQLSKFPEPFAIPSIVYITIRKSTPDQKLGLAFRKSKGVVIIEKISPGSAFDGSELKVGMECLCINEHRVRSARRAAEIVR
jgi:hypothetical protein